MPRKTQLKVKCPICKQAVTRGAADFPFCSERCRLIDLGKWASGQYVVSSPVADTSEELRDQFTGGHSSSDED